MGPNSSKDPFKISVNKLRAKELLRYIYTNINTLGKKNIYQVS